MSHSETSRRRFVLLAGGVLATGLAGCAGGGTTLTGTAGTAETDAMSNARAQATGPATATNGALPTTNDPTSAVANGMAAVRIAHLSPDAPNVDVRVDGRQALSNVGFGTVTPYVVLTPGSHNVRVTLAGHPLITVYDNDLSVDAKAYTVAAFGEVSGANHPFAVEVFTIDATAPPRDAAAVRLVHAAPDVPAVDVTAKGSNRTLFENVAFGQASDYVTLPAGTHTLEVRAHTPNHDGQVLETADVTLRGGTVDSVFAVGSRSPPAGAANDAFRLVVAPESGGSS